MKNMKSFLLLYSLIFISMFLSACIDLADADSKLDVNVRVVKPAENASVITGQAIKPSEKINVVLSSLTSRIRDNKAIITAIAIIFVLIVYIIFRIRNKKKLKEKIK